MDSLVEVVIKVEYDEDNEVDPFSKENIENDKDVENTNECDKNILQISYEPENNEDEKEIFQDGTWYECKDDSGRLLCRYCNQDFLKSDSLRHHIKTKHAEECEVNYPAKKRYQKLKCHVCQKNFQLLADLKKHFKLNHQKDSKNFCHICRAHFNDQCSLAEHMSNTHNILFSKLHSCDICGYRTLKISHFNQHRSSHMNDKTHKCKQCDYSSYNLSNLKVHERIHGDPELLFVCDFEGCNHRTTTSASLKQHTLTHNNERNFLFCDKCSFKTLYKQSLKRHVFTHSRNKV